MAEPLQNSQPAAPENPAQMAEPAQPEQPVETTPQKPEGFSADYVKSLREENKRRRIEAKELTAKVNGLNSKVKGLLLKAAFGKEAARAGVAHPDDAYKLADLSGVAVDDTIHYLPWFRDGLDKGWDRKRSALWAYERCATAMTQTTLIGGFGLSVFAFSSFTPTQRFGVLMLTLLAVALVGDLIFLPALLTGPVGGLFRGSRKRRPAPSAPPQTEPRPAPLSTCPSVRGKSAPRWARSSACTGPRR